MIVSIKLRVISFCSFYFFDGLCDFLQLSQPTSELSRLCWLQQESRSPYSVNSTPLETLKRSNGRKSSPTERRRSLLFTNSTADEWILSLKVKWSLSWMNCTPVMKLTKENEGCYRCIFEADSEDALTNTTCIWIYGKTVQSIHSSLLQKMHHFYLVYMVTFYVFLSVSLTIQLKILHLKYVVCIYTVFYTKI